MKRIVVTGMGTINPLGHTVEETWTSIKAGKSGIGPYTRFASLIDTKIGGEVKGFDPVPIFGPKETRRMDRFAHFAVFAAMEAVRQANYTVTPENMFETGIIIGVGGFGADTLQESMETLEKFGMRRVKPTSFPAVLSNMGSAQTAMHLGIRGVNYGVAAACATSAIAIGEGAEVIRRGDAEMMLCGGAEGGLAKLPLVGLSAMRAMSTRNDVPEEASRPFDKTRDGFVPAEGAAVLVLESLDHAQARGAKILGELVGYASTCDAVHVSAPDETGAAVAYAMRHAMKKAGITIQDIDYINAHGTSTPLNDLQETRVIKQVFGERAYDVPVSSTKSMTGHAMSTSGALEAIFSVMALNDGIIPPTINYHHPDPECDLDYVPNVARKANLRYVMSDSFGFGGQNGILIFKKWEGQ